MGRCCGCAESISRWPAVRPRSATETSWNRSPPNRPSRNQKQHNPTRRQLRNRVRSFGMNSPSRAGLRRCGAQLGVISVGPDSQSTCIKVCRIGCGAQLGVISVGPGSQSTCTKVCRIGRGAQLGAIAVGPDTQSTCIKVCRIGCGAQLGVISVGPGSQSTCTKVCRIGRGA